MLAQIRQMGPEVDLEWTWDMRSEMSSHREVTLDPRWSMLGLDDLHHVRKRCR